MNYTKNKTSVEVILDSQFNGSRLTTLKVNFPRFILAEINTHRKFSRNYQSSRAVPVKKQLIGILKSPFVPTVFLNNTSGMQGADEIVGIKSAILKGLWILNGYSNVGFSYIYQLLGVHKQHSNRNCEYFSYSIGLITSTEWKNFLLQRTDGAAQPEFRDLAIKIENSIATSIPTKLKDGEYHLPFISDGELQRYDLKNLVKISISRIASISYRKIEMDVYTNLKVYEKLISNKIKHFSPFEMVAQAKVGRFDNFENFQSIRNKLSCAS